jgi:hypothetical protein
MSVTSVKSKGPLKPKAVRPYTKPRTRSAPKDKPMDVTPEVWERKFIRWEYATAER